MLKWIVDFKERFDVYLGPLMRLLVKWGINPYHITAVSFIFGIISVFFLYFNQTLFVILSLAHLFLDKLDGTLARFLNNTTKFGKLLDHSADLLVLLFLLIKSYYVFPSTGTLFFTSKFVLVTILVCLILAWIQIFIKKSITFGSHLTAIALFMFKQYGYAILATFLISITGIIFQIMHEKR